VKSHVFWGITKCSSLKGNDVSEKHDASIFRVEKRAKQVAGRGSNPVIHAPAYSSSFLRCRPKPFLAFLAIWLALSSTLKMEAICSSENMGGSHRTIPRSSSQSGLRLGYELDDRGNGVRFLAEAIIFHCPRDLICLQGITWPLSFTIWKRTFFVLMEDTSVCELHLGSSRITTMPIAFLEAPRTFLRPSEVKATKCLSSENTFGKTLQEKWNLRVIMYT
jgi:hypothetical protein